MELKQLQYFVVSADMGSFQNAAKMLYTTQPHVSKTVKALEDELHLKLLVRESRGVRVTAEGKKVYDYASVILKNSDMIGRINEENSAKKLAVAVMPGIRLAQVCADFYTGQEGKMQFSMLQGCMEDILGFMHKHVAEIGFVYVSEHQLSALNQTLEHKRLEFVPMKETRMALIVGKNHPLFGADSVDEAELKNLRYIQYAEDYFSLIHHLGHLNDSVRRFSKMDDIVTTNSDAMLYHMVADGALCHLGCELLIRHFHEKVLHTIPLTAEEDGIIYFGYVKRVRDTISRISAELIEYVNQNI
ncbi:MAG TPA: hypothetical protein DF613_16095 [Lachnospiraceae bacterium]|nr:hypothetical protein [Lachnospiraceae bacterium]